jgi:hypothetical protein
MYTGYNGNNGWEKFKFAARFELAASSRLVVG